MRHVAIIAALVACFVITVAERARAQESTGTKRRPVLSSDDVAAKDTPNAPPGATTELYINSDKGDLIGRGRTQLFADGQFTLQYWRNTPDKPGAVSNLSFSVDIPEGGWLHFQFSTDKMNLNLEPGFYDNAVRTGTNARGQPGMSIDGNGASCSASFGSFKILQADFSYKSGKLVANSFAAEFEQHCRGRAASLRGHIYYNYVPTKGPA
jgi:hypothetical protein